MPVGVDVYVNFSEHVSLDSGYMCECQAESQCVDACLIG